MEGSSCEITSLESSDMLSIYDTNENVDGKVTVANLASYLISSGYVSGGVNGGGVTTTLDIGTVVNWAGHTWIVVHVGEALTYLALKNINTTTIFNSGTSMLYNGSVLAAAAKTFENSLPSVALLNAVDQTVEGVTAKIFVPTYAQCNGGFDYYKTQSNRVAYYGGTAVNWWTSSKYGTGSTNGGLNTVYLCYCVKASGSLEFADNYQQINIAAGFRPHVALRL